MADPLNREFLRLFEASGWTQSATARQLSLSPAVVSQYLSGETRPSRTVIRLLQLLLGDCHPLPTEVGPGRESSADLLPLEVAERDLIARLRRLPSERRGRILAGFLLSLEGLGTETHETGPTELTRSKRSRVAGR